MASTMMLFSCTLRPCSSSSIFFFFSSLPRSAALVPFSSISCVTPCSSSRSSTWQQTCSSNNPGGGEGGVTVSSSHLTRTRNSLQRKRRTRTHHRLLFATTQEERFLENGDESPPPLVITDLRELSESPSTEAASASDAEGTRQAQDTQAEEEENEGGGGVGPSVEEAKEVAGILRPGTKTVPLNKGRGAKVADFLMVYGGLLDRPFGSGAMIAATGDVVIERVQQEIESLRGIEGVNEQILFEILRFLRLLEMDLKLVGAAKQESTLFQRLEQAKKHCREALLLANSF
ncbi:unnamed protein product [Sphagnum jensenii]|uniref:Chlororespiratory reduction 41 n=1 Tax=Sphagnum jensenii TaxID=128206 RepID=A0ABP1B5D0_9BRYO